MSKESSELIRQAVGGNADSLRALLEQFGNQVWHEIRSQIGRPWQASVDPDDVMQVTYVEAFLRIGTFASSETPAFVAWLRRIAENNLRDAIKELDRKKRPSPMRQVRAPNSDESRIALLEQLGVESTTPSRHAARSEARLTLDDALDRLPPHYSAVVRMYDLEGLEIADVAQRVGRSPAAVHMLRARAHDHLRSLLGAAGNFFSDA